MSKATEEALAEAKKTVPGWAYAVLAQAFKGTAEEGANDAEVSEEASEAEEPAEESEPTEEATEKPKGIPYSGASAKEEEPAEEDVSASEEPVAETEAESVAEKPASQSEEPDPTQVVQTLTALWQWAKDKLPADVAASKDGKKVSKRGGGTRAVANLAQLKAATRWAFDERGSAGVVLVASDGSRASLSKRAYSQVASVVPTYSPDRPRLALVGLNPSTLDAARGEPFTGADGRCLVDQYLKPLGLTKRDVMLTNVLPVAGNPSAEDMVQWVGWAKRELDLRQPDLVVALGKVAKKELGDRADFVLPHPAAVQKYGCSGELVRKLKQIKERLDQNAVTKRVAIAKVDAMKQTAYCVVLDPYEVDSQKDWAPPKHVEKAGHEYLRKYRVVGLQHEGIADADVVESWMWPYPSNEDYAAAMENRPHKAYRQTFGNQKVHSGSWVMGIKMNDTKLWKAMQDGEITGVSIGGTGHRSPLNPADMPEVEFIDV